MSQKAFFNLQGLNKFLPALKQRRLLFFTFFFTVVTVVTLVSFMVKPVYRASVTLMIDEESPNMLTTSGAVTLNPQSYYSYREYFQTQVEILTSESIIRRVFDEFALEGREEFVKAKEPLREFLKSIKTEPLRDTRLLKLHVENRDPVLAAKIANFMSQLYVERNLYYISRNELLNLLKNEYLKLESKFSEYSKIYKEQHPEMARLNKEIKEITQKIEETKEFSFDFNPLASDGSKYAITGLKANNVNIQDPAETPKVPVRPKKGPNILFSLLFGSIGGVGLVLAFERLDETIKTGEDVEGLNICPFLGVIPKIAKINSAEQDIKEFIAHKRPREPVSEAFRVLRTSIIYSATEERPARTLAVTSCVPEEGKTTVLTNLAIVMTQLDKRVLIVDADMRKPRLNTVFNLPNDLGLSSFLCGQADIGQVIRKTEIENLCIVTSGPHPPNPSELLESSRFKEFIRLVKMQFDTVLIDTPPVAAVTDAVIVSNLVEGVLLVAESQRTQLRAFSRTIKILKDAKARIVGALVNKFPLSPYRDYYYYYSHYYSAQEDPQALNGKLPPSFPP